MQSSMDNLLSHAQDLSEAGNYDDAYRIANKCLKNDPNNPQWLNVMAHLMLETEKPSLAYQLAKRVTDIRPRDSVGWLNLGVACRDMRLDEEALRHFKRSLKYSQTPDRASMAHVNISSSLIDMGQFKEAEPHCLKALEQNSESKKAIMNLAFSQLGQKNWEGWTHYREIIGHHWRPRCKYNDEPLWDGVSRGTICLYGEQGLGDQISFASMLPDALKWAQENDSRIVVETVPRLVKLFERSFGVETYGTLGTGNWPGPKVDYSLPIGQIAEYFRTKDEDFPGKPYLKADPDRVLQWKALFESKGKPTIGIAWSSGVFSTGSKFRRVDLEALLPVLESVDAHWVSLQYKPAQKEIDELKLDIDLVEYPYGTLSGDYDDTVSMVAAMDLVICMHTTVGHVAGGLGVPCWTLVPMNSQWRYGYEGEDYIWCDSVRLIRQEKRGEWSDVIQKVATELEAKFSPIRAMGDDVVRVQSLQ